MVTTVVAVVKGSLRIFLLLLLRTGERRMYAPMENKPHNWTPQRIKELRGAFGERQEEFCKRFRVSLGALRIWEQGQGEPSGPVTVILDRLQAEVESRQPEAASA